MHLTVRDTAAWGIILFHWQSRFTLRRPVLHSASTIYSLLDRGASLSAAVKAVLETGTTLAEGLEKAFKPDRQLNQLWSWFEKCVQAFKASKTRLVHAVWDDMSSAERSTRAILQGFILYVHRAKTVNSSTVQSSKCERYCAARLVDLAMRDTETSTSSGTMEMHKCGVKHSGWCSVGWRHH
jgi:hypothetical protein